LPWLVRDDEVVASVEIAERRSERTRGLLGRSAFEGALLLRPARSVHTFGMRFPIDVAFLDEEMRVLRVVTVRANRLPRPEWRARAVVEAEAGAFERWNLRRGDRLVVRGDDEARR
jgi:uncharacterized membrane protein (UPF0127 family)